MCVNYLGVSDWGILSTYFGAQEMDELASTEEAWPLSDSPFIRLDKLGRRRVENGQFGLLPGFAKETAFGRNTYNARSESIETKNSFRHAWQRGQRCIIPSQHIFEPYYEPVEIWEQPSKPVRWKISKANSKPMPIAGIYNTWISPKGKEIHSFSMLTVNADQHPFMRKFHAPGDEKRMVVILYRDQMDDWLTCSPGDAKRFFLHYSGELVGLPAPVKPRKAKAKLEKPRPPPDPQMDLFG